jgi:hypothetical protein
MMGLECDAAFPEAVDAITDFLAPYDLLQMSSPWYRNVGSADWVSLADFVYVRAVMACQAKFCLAVP